MAIQPPSDIVLDVIRAADPAARNRATQKLQAIAGSGRVGTASTAGPSARVRGHSAPRSLFARELVHATRHQTGAAMPDSASAAQAQSAQAQSARSLKAVKQYEAFVMQSFVQSMLPKDANATYGKKTAGQFWKSMMAQEIGKEVSKSTRLGIAEAALARTAPARVEAVTTPRIKPVVETAASEPVRSGPVAFLSRLMNGLREVLARIFGGHESRVASSPSTSAAG